VFGTKDWTEQQVYVYLITAVTVVTLVGFMLCWGTIERLCISDSFGDGAVACIKAIEK
jgi:hypothetical protein